MGGKFGKGRSKMEVGRKLTEAFVRDRISF